YDDTRQQLASPQTPGRGGRICAVHGLRQRSLQRRYRLQVLEWWRTPRRDGYPARHSERRSRYRRAGADLFSSRVSVFSADLRLGDALEQPACRGRCGDRVGDAALRAVSQGFHRQRVGVYLVVLDDTVYVDRQDTVENGGRSAGQ